MFLLSSSTPAPFLVPFPSLITPSSVYLRGPLNGYAHVFGCTGVGGTEMGTERVLAECGGDDVCVWVRAGGAGTGRAWKGGCEWTWTWRSGRTAGSETRLFSPSTRRMNQTCTTCGLLPPLSPSARFHGTHADAGVGAVQDGPPIDPLLYLPMRRPGPEFTCSSAQQTHHISQSSSFHSRRRMFLSGDRWAARRLDHPAQIRAHARRSAPSLFPTRCSDASLDAELERSEPTEGLAYGIIPQSRSHDVAYFLLHLFGNVQVLIDDRGEHLQDDGIREK